MTEKMLAKRVLRAMKLHQEGSVAWDDTLYAIESMARAECGLSSMRAYRDDSGTLHADWLDSPHRVYEAVGYARLDPNQLLPENPYHIIADHGQGRMSYNEYPEFQVRYEAQQEMWSRGFRRVIVPEEKKDDEKWANVSQV